MERISLSKRMRFEVLKRDSFKCQYCGNGAPEVLLHVDHIKPVAEGGTDEIWNLITACQPCNSGKSDKLLSDSSAVVKAKKQMDSLQERREQLEMLMEWQTGLCNIESEAVFQLVEFAESCVRRKFLLNPQGKDDIRKLLKKFSFEEVISAIRDSTRYLQVDADGNPTVESVEVMFSKIGAVCVVNRRSGGDQSIKDLYYIRGILRRRLEGRYYNEPQAFEWLEAAVSWSIPIERITKAVKASTSWTNFRSRICDLIDDAKQRQIGNE